MSNIKDSIMYHLKFGWRSSISQIPRLYAVWNGLRSPSTVVGVSKEATDLVLEGYPRSGNTFAWHAFMMSQTRPFNIIHHSHNAARIIEAVKKNIPTLVLIRNPRDCVISYCIYEPKLSVRMALVHWLRFYRAISPFKDEFVLAKFREVITDFGQVVTSVNERFGTQFETFIHTDKNVERVFEQMEFRTKLIAKRVGYSDVLEHKISRPSETRVEKKKILDEALNKNRKLISLLHTAEDLYCSY